MQSQRRDSRSKPRVHFISLQSQSEAWYQNSQYEVPWKPRPAAGIASMHYTCAPATTAALRIRWRGLRH